MIKTLTASLAAAAVAITSAQAAILTGEGQLTGPDGDVVGAFTVEVDTTVTQTVCLNDTVDRECERAVVSRQLTFDFEGLGRFSNDSAMATFYLDPTLGAITIDNSLGGRADPKSASTGIFAFGNDFASFGLLIVQALEGDLVTGVFEFNEDSLVSGQFAFTVEGLSADAVPLPAGAWLFASGLAGVLAARRRS